MKKYITMLLMIILQGLYNTSFPQWTEVNTGLTNLNTPSITAYDELVYVATLGAGVFKTSDFGSNWTAINSLLGNLNVHYVYSQGLILAGTENGIYIHPPTDGDWISQPTTGLTNTTFNYITMSEVNSESRFTVATPDGVFRQIANNEGWAPVNNGIPTGSLFINSLAGYKSPTINYVIAGTNDGVYMSFDELASWQRKTNGLTGDALVVNGVGSLGAGALAATNGGLYITLDQGENWQAMIAAQRIFTMAIGRLPGGSTIIFAFGDNGYWTTDFTTWHQINMSGVGGEYVVSMALTTDYVFISTKSGGVYRMSLAGLTDVKEISSAIPGDYKLLQNYPNPFNPSTSIRFQIPARSAGGAELVTLKVYDLLGNEITTLVNEEKEPGTYEVSFNASSLASGVYYYKLTSGSFSEINKMMLLK